MVIGGTFKFLKITCGKEERNRKRVPKLRKKTIRIELTGTSR